MPGMPVLVNSVLAALPKLGNVVVVLSLLLVVMGITGVHVYQGSMHYRCALPGYVEPAAHPSLIDPGIFYSYTESAADSHMVGRSLGAATTRQGRRLSGVGAFEPLASQWDTGTLCDPTAYDDLCITWAGIEGSHCMYFADTPNYNFTSFDTFGTSVIIIMQALTFDEWAEAMYDLMDATRTNLVVAFWVIAVFFGGFFLVNLFLAVLFQEFVAAQAMEKAVAEDKTKRLLEASARREKRVKAVLAVQRRFRRRKGNYDHKSDTAWSEMLGQLEKHKREREQMQRRKLRLSRASAESHASGDGHSIADDSERDDTNFWDRPPKAGSWRMQLSDVVSASWFGNISISLVLLNLVLMCLPYYGMPKEDEERLESYATAISWAFIVEMGLKLTAYGCAAYWNDSWNFLDGVIVSLSIFEMIMTALASGTGIKLSFLRILRMLRVARVLRLMKAWKGLYKIVSTIIKALPQLSNVMILLILISTIFALLGMQLFGGMFTEELGYGPSEEGLTPLTRFHFDYFVPAMLTVFIVMTGDAWYIPMLDGVSVLGPPAAIFYVVVMLIGTYLMMNLLVAVLLQLFSEKEADAQAPGSAAKDSTATDDGDSNPSHPKEVDASGTSMGADVQVMREQDNSLGCFPPDNEFRREARDLIESAVVDQLLLAVVFLSSLALVLDTPRIDPGSAFGISLRIFNYLFTIAFLFEVVGKSIAYGFWSTPKAYLRTSWNVLDFVLLLISLGAILSEIFPQLAFLRPLRALRVLRPLRILSRSKGMMLVLSSLFDAMPAVGNVFGVLIALQVVFAILGMQLFSGMFQACTDPNIMNPMDCREKPDVVGRALTSVRSSTPMAWNESSILLAPSITMDELLLRDLERHEAPVPLPELDELNNADEKLVSETYAMERRARSKAMGMEQRTRGRQLKGGGAYTGPLEWKNPIFGSFDDFGQSMLLLFVMSTADDWDKIMFWAMDSVGPGEPRVRNDFSGACLFFVAWTFVGCFFAMQLFVGVVVEQFNSIRAQKDGSATMTVEQKQWKEAMKTMMRTKAKVKPRQAVRLFDEVLRGILESTTFKALVKIVVIGSGWNQCADHWGLSPSDDYYVIRRSFTGFFAAESVLKLYTFGYEFWTKDDWCAFESLLVAVSVVDELGVTRAICWLLGLSPYVAKFAGAFQALRVLRLVQDVEELQKLLETIVLSIPSLVNVALLLALVVYIYSVLGVQLFTFLERGEMFTEDRNFDTFGNALLLSFESLTGDGWSSLMFEAYVDKKDGGAHAIPYFLSYQLLCSSVILNLAVAVILENFTSLGDANEDLISPEDIIKFTHAWSDLDPRGTQVIPVARLPDLLGRLPLPMGLKGAPRQWILRMSLNLGVSSETGTLIFKDVLNAVVEYNFRQQSQDPEARQKVTSFIKDRRSMLENDPDDETQEDEDSHPALRTTYNMLWGDDNALTTGQRLVARALMLEMLRHLQLTKNFMSVIALATEEQRRRKRHEIQQELKVTRQMTEISFQHRATLMPQNEEDLAKSFASKVSRSEDGSWHRGWKVAATKSLVDDRDGRPSEDSSKAKDSRTRVSISLVPTTYAPKDALSATPTESTVAAAPTPSASSSSSAANALLDNHAEEHSAGIPVQPTTAFAGGEPKVDQAMAAKQGHVGHDIEEQPSPDHRARLAATRLAAAEETAKAARKEADAARAEMWAISTNIEAERLAEIRAAQESKRRSEMAMIAEMDPTSTFAQVQSRVAEIQGQVAAASMITGSRIGNQVHPLRTQLFDSSKRMDTTHGEGSYPEGAHGFFLKPAVGLEQLPSPRGALRFEGNTIVVTIEGDLAQFDRELEKEFLRRLGAYGRVPVAQLVVLGKRSGSIVLEIGVLDSEAAPLVASQMVKAVDRVTVAELSSLLGCKVLAKSVTPADGYAPLMLPGHKLLSEVEPIVRPLARHPISAITREVESTSKVSSARSSDSEIAWATPDHIPTAFGISVDETRGSSSPSLERRSPSPSLEHVTTITTTTTYVPFQAKPVAFDEWWKSPSIMSPSVHLPHARNDSEQEDRFLQRLEVAESHDRAAKLRRDCRECGLCGLCVTARPQGGSNLLLEKKKLSSPSSPNVVTPTRSHAASPSRSSASPHKRASASPSRSSEKMNYHKSSMSSDSTSSAQLSNSPSRRHRRHHRRPGSRGDVSPVRI